MLAYSRSRDAHILNPADHAERGTWHAAPFSWAVAPFRVVSLGDMLRVHANDFAMLLRVMRQLQETLEDRSIPDSEGIDRIHVYLETIQPICVRLELRSAQDQFLRIRQREMEDLPPLDAYLPLLAELSHRIDDELKARVFMFISGERAQFFSDRLFGDAVHDRFTEMTDDIEQAGQCLGADLPTAAVFHLMRVVEFGIHRLAARLRIARKKVQGKTWDPILKAINDKLAQVKRRELRRLGAEATAHLNLIRIAWRNPVMHLEGTYTQKAAEEIFTHVKTFTRGLAETQLF